jgi:undecaprenyl-diphosphatase
MGTPSGHSRTDLHLSSAAGLLLAFLVMASLLLAFALIAGKVHSGSSTEFDRDILLWFRSAGEARLPIGAPWVQEMARDISALGSFTVLGCLLLGSVGYFLLTRRYAFAGTIIVAALGGVALNSILKEVFGRERPDLVVPLAHVFTPSFPSGHSTLSAMVYLSLAILLARAVGERQLGIYFVSIGVLLTAAIGISRVYLGVHYPTDVLAGWCVGSAWALGCWLAISLAQGRTKQGAETF